MMVDIQVVLVNAEIGFETFCCRHINFTRAHHRDEKPERDLTYHLTCLLIYHGTTTPACSSLLFFK